MFPKHTPVNVTQLKLKQIGARVLVPAKYDNDFCYDYIGELNKDNEKTLIEAGFTINNFATINKERKEYILTKEFEADINVVLVRDLSSVLALYNATKRRFYGNGKDNWK